MYNAAFGGINTEEFYLFTIPAIITVVITGLMFSRSVKQGDRIFSLSSAAEVVWKIGVGLFLLDSIILYIMDPVEDGIILNILSYLILAFAMLIVFLMFSFIPFCIMTFLLSVSHDISFKKRYNFDRVNDIAKSDRNNEEKIRLIVDEIGVKNANIIKLVLCKLLQCDIWKTTEYRGVTYYLICIMGYYKEPRALYIEMPFDDDMLQTVQNGCNNYDYPGFKCVYDEDFNRWFLQYDVYFNSKEERDVAYDDIKTIAGILNISKQFHFYK